MGNNVIKYRVEEGKGPLIAPLPFSDAEYAARLAKLRSAMRAEGLDVFVAFSPENIFWLTGHDSPAYHYVQACVVSLDDPPVNVLRRIDATNTLLRSWARRAASYGDSGEPMEVLAGVIQEMKGAHARIGVETDSFFVSARRFEILRKLLGRSLVPAQLVEPLRLIKSAEELGMIRAAARLTKAAMETAVGMAREGVNENHIAGAVWNTLVSMGSEFPGLPPFIVSGPRTSLGHATWAGHVLAKRDPVVFEIPGTVNRYVAPSVQARSARRRPRCGGLRRRCWTRLTCSSGRSGRAQSPGTFTKRASRTSPATAIRSLTAAVIRLA